MENRMLHITNAIPTIENSSALILPLLLRKNTYQAKKTNEKITERTDIVFIVKVLTFKKYLLW
jgi:hypothetical protein